MGRSTELRGGEIEEWERGEHGPASKRPNRPEDLRVLLAPPKPLNYLVMRMLGLALVAVMAATPEVGELAPDFTVKDVDGHELTLSKLVEEGPVILAFFPKARTSG